MILRPLHDDVPAAGNVDPGVMEPVWTAIERSQQQDFSHGCWLIPQPAHAALSGDIALALDLEAFPGMDSELTHAFALHDSGWSLPDAAIIQESRAKGESARIRSFIAVDMAETAEAWSGSIKIAGKASRLGEYLVSRHFFLIGQADHRAKDALSQSLLQDFLAHESARQQKLRKNLTESDAQLNRLTEALQFCDLLSLYIACGLQDNVEFLQSINGEKMILTRTEDGAAIRPSPFKESRTFNISALRHPRSKQDSTAIFQLSLV